MLRFIHIFNRTITGNYPIPKISLHRTQLYSTSISSPLQTTPPAAEDSSFANYLVNSLGFSILKAHSASNKVSKYRTRNAFKFHSNVVSVVGFFKSRGFDDTHLRRILYRDARLLCSNVDTLSPKLRFLQDQGFSQSDIIGVVSANPRLLNSGVESSILPAFEVLRKVTGSDTHLIALLKRSRAFHFTSIKYLAPNVALLTSYGISIELIRKHLIAQPTPFMRKPEIFKDMVTKVKNKWGICLVSPMFLIGIQLACRLSEENIEAKCRMFKRFGWTQSDIQSLMMKNPACFGSSVASIEKKLNFLMNELRLEAGYLTTHSALFTYSLEKRIVPRHKILLFLNEKGLLENNPSFSTAFNMTESRFLKKFVLPFEETHEVYAELAGCSMKMLTHESSKTPLK